MATVAGNMVIDEFKIPKLIYNHTPEVYVIIFVCLMATVMWHNLVRSLKEFNVFDARVVINSLDEVLQEL